MGFDGEYELRPTVSIKKRIKHPGKFLHDESVDHASVPRKLRSAMKKRNRDSVSPPLSNKKKPIHGINRVELPGKDGTRKSEPTAQQEDAEEHPSWPVVGPITKDEEEVVETLSALAEMFPSSNKMNDVDSELAKAKYLALSQGESLRPAFEAPQKVEESKPVFSEAPNPSFSEESAQEIVEAKCSSDHRDFDTVSQRNTQTKSLLSKSEPINGKPSSSSVGSKIQSELSLGLKQPPKYEEAATRARQPEITIGQNSDGSRDELPHALKERKNSGAALWPSLSSHCTATQQTFLRSTTNKIPPWLSMATSVNRPSSLENGPLNVKTMQDSKAPVPGKKSWKRCSAHIYISRLVKVLQISENANRSSTQLIPNEGSKQEDISAANSPNRMRNGLSGYNMGGSSSADKNPNEVWNAILLQKRLLQDQLQAPTTSVLCNSQSFDFLSLSARGNGIDVTGIDITNSTKEGGNGLEPSTQFHIPHLQSLAQSQPVTPFFVPPTGFSSSSFTDHLPVDAAKQLQVRPHPSYLGCPVLGTSHLGSNASQKQLQQQQPHHLHQHQQQPHHLQQQQQQQHSFWTAQLAAQYRSMGLTATRIPNWQNGREDNSSGIQFAQSTPQPLHSSLEVLGAKYAQFSPQQQQQFIAITPSALPTNRAIRQNLHPDTSLPLQLLCNERL